MQTIIFNDSNISAYVFNDSDSVSITADNIICSNFIIGDMNSTNSTVITDVTTPADWQGGKYLFDGTDWTANTSWIDPKLDEITRLEEELAILKGL
jgi:hypothetical protein